MSSPTPAKHKVLLVEDDDFLRPELVRCLEDAGYEASGVGGGKDAKHLLSLHDFDAVVSDINMPEINGIQLFNWIKAHRPMPVILMTGFADLAETLDAHNCGAAAFLAKPFKRDELTRAVRACFPVLSDASAPATCDLDDEFRGLSLDDFVSGSDIRFDIYVRLASDKYVKIAHSGQDITVDRIRAYKEKGIRSLYMTREDFKSYVRFAVGLVGAVAGSDRVTQAKKANFLKHAAEILASSFFSEGLDPGLVTDVKAVVGVSVDLLSDNADAIGVLDSLRSHADFVYAHSVAVTFYSVLIARTLGWSSAAILKRLALGAMLHDIGKKEIPRELLLKTRKDLSAIERATLESHTSRGADILGGIAGIPSDVAQIALEHHETCVGMGYPRRIRRDKIHPFARVVAVADAFCEHVMKSPVNSGMKPVEALRRMTSLEAEYFDPDPLLALAQLFGLELPETFADDLRKRQRAA
jgi:putative nucleotidyltransferase with HDIG domain